VSRNAVRRSFASMPIGIKRFLKANPELLRSTFELEDKLDVAWFAGRLEDAT
jgi:hypothetical protein